MYESQEHYEHCMAMEAEYYHEAESEAAYQQSLIEQERQDAERLLENLTNKLDYHLTQVQELREQIQEIKSSMP